MKRIALLLLLISISACAGTQNTISLSTNERLRAQSIAETRQRIAFDRQGTVSRYQHEMNALNDEETDLNIVSAKLCFELKKVHKLDPSANYTLDEWNGQLVKH